MKSGSTGWLQGAAEHKKADSLVSREGTALLVGHIGYTEGGSPTPGSLLKLQKPRSKHVGRAHKHLHVPLQEAIKPALATPAAHLPPELPDKGKIVVSGDVAACGDGGHLQAGCAGRCCLPGVLPACPPHVCLYHDIYRYRRMHCPPLLPPSLVPPESPPPLLPHAHPGLQAAALKPPCSPGLPCCGRC